jgi:hypothetical protein
MKLSLLLEKLKQEPDIDIHEERSLKDDGARVLTFSTRLPFPKFEPVWFSMVVHSDDEDVPEKKVEAMLRHLWMFQLDLLPDAREDGD